MPEQRVTELDFMRAAAIFMVVVLHVTARFMMYSPPKTHAFILGLALNQWSRVCLPLFVFLSGFGLFYNNKGFELKTYAKKRLSRVFLPYCVWTLLYMIRWEMTDPSFHFLKLPILTAVLKYIRWLFWENIDTPLWFILMIMQMYILFPFILNYVQNAKPVKALIINTVIYLPLVVYLRYFRVHIGFAPIDFIQKYCSYNPLGWYFYFIMGGLLAANWDRVKKIRPNAYITGALYLAATALVIAEAYGGFLNKGRPYLESYTSVRPSVLLDTLAIIPFLFLIGKKIRHNGFVSEALKSISRYSYGIYFVHPQILAALNVGLVHITGGSYTARTIYMMLLIFFTFALSYLFCLIMDNSHLRLPLLGLERRK